MTFPLIDWWRIGANLLKAGVAYLLARLSNDGVISETIYEELTGDGV